MDFADDGKRALGLLRQSTERAMDIQRQTLLRLVERNRDTVFGRVHHFDAINSVADYQRLVPLSTYADYDTMIAQMVQGQTHLLTAEPPVYFAISSGSTDFPKYVPVSLEDMQTAYDFAYVAPFGMVSEYYAKRNESDVFGKIFQTGEFVKTYTSRGVMNGIRSSAMHQWKDEVDPKGYPLSAYTAPHDVLFPHTVCDLTYAKVRFALQEPDVMAIHGVFVHHVLRVLQYIENNWDMLLDDMETGTISDEAQLPKEYRARARKWFSPQPARARQLRAIDRQNLADNLVKKLWPKTRYALMVSGDAFADYERQIRRYIGDIPIHYSVYGASEAVLGLCSGLDEPDSYMMIPQAGLFEFLPLDARPGDVPLTIADVKQGERYEVIVTNCSGLYRYRMNDVIEVKGFCGQSPIVGFCYRKNQVLKVADEKLDTLQMDSAVEEFQKLSSIALRGYCARTDIDSSPGCYVFYIECADEHAPLLLSLHQAQTLLDGCLSRANFGYDSCRRSHDIEPLKIVLLKPGAFGRFKEHRAALGYEMGQSKPLKVLTSADDIAFFQGEAMPWENQERHVSKEMNHE